MYYFTIVRKIASCLVEAHSAMMAISRRFIGLLQVLRTVVAHKHASDHAVSHEHDKFAVMVHHIQDYLFPFSARYNSILATLLIQLVPCFIIFSIPGLKGSQTSGQDNILLPVLVSFAFGTLLGDILLHLIPEIFEPLMGKTGHSHSSVIIAGSAIFAGFMAFLFLDKSLRLMSMGTGEEISLSTHSHSHVQESDSVSSTSAVEASHTSSELNQRKVSKSAEPAVEKPTETHHSHPKPNIAGYLNIVTACVHNITDGIALASGFYSSKHVGTTTTIAVMFHEIPHEIGDFVILLSSGFTFAQALKSQLVTSIGAMVGTAIGCALNEINSPESGHTKPAHWIMQSNMLLPISTGGFIYIATVGVAPQLLRFTTSNKSQEIKIWLLQLVSIIVGFGMMTALALLE